VGFVVDKVALGQFSLSTSVFSANHFTNCSTFIFIHHSDWYNRPNSGQYTNLTRSHPSPHLRSCIETEISVRRNKPMKHSKIQYSEETNLGYDNFIFVSLPLCLFISLFLTSFLSLSFCLSFLFCFLTITKNTN
jgi:hypothetical protein